MNILYIVPYVPNLVRVRPFNLIRALAARGHQVTVATLWTDAAERADLRVLESHGLTIAAFPLPRRRSLWNAFKTLPTSTPLQAAYCWQPALADWLDEAMSAAGPGFDIVHVEHLRGAAYALYLRQAMAAGRLPRRPIVWDAVDSIAHLFRQAADQRPGRLGRWLTRFELGRTERYEGRLTGQFDHVLVTSATDKAALLALHDGPPAPLTVLANGVDLDYFQPAPAGRATTPTLVVSGKMSYHANISMCRHLLADIMPNVWSNRPEVQVWLVGKDPPREIRALAALPAVTVTGTVSDIRPYLQAATMAVAPTTYGAGIQNKVLEAMACGTPVIASPAAAAALAVQPGRDLLVADGAADFAGAILDLLAKPGRRHEIGQAGLAYVRTAHNWANAVRALEEVYVKVVEQHHDRPTIRAAHPPGHTTPIA